MATPLPGWVVDNRESMKREAARYRDMSDTQRLELIAAASRAAARMLSLRDDRDLVLSHEDPLPESSRLALKRLREEAKARAESGDTGHD